MVRSAWWIWITGLVLVLAVGYFWWADTAIELLDTMQETQVVQERSIDDSAFAWDDEYEVFVSKVLWSNDSLRGAAFTSSGLFYEKPRLVLFRWSTQSACGGAVSQIWPHYCPVDKTIYLDETFFEDMRKRLWAKWWDVAQAYVIAHEVGHHVQNLLWTTDLVTQARRRSVRAWNEASIKLELQADCLAGIRAWSIDSQWVLEENEIYEAIDAAEAVGDDSIQKRTTGTIQPESWTHGSSAQRKERFSLGFKTGDFAQCDTFG